METVRSGQIQGTFWSEKLLIDFKRKSIKLC